MDKTQIPDHVKKYMQQIKAESPQHYELFSQALKKKPLEITKDYMSVLIAKNNEFLSKREQEDLAKKEQDLKNA